MEKIVEALMKWCERKGRVLKITGSAGADDVYLIRYYVIKSAWFNVFIHQFLRSDRDDLHDHPWNFITYLVRGAYTEMKWNEKHQCVEATRRHNYIYDDYMQKVRLKQNTLVYRKATDQHQVVVDKDLKEIDKDKAALTLFISGPTKREWGFIVNSDSPFYNDRKAGIKLRCWVEWRKYLGLPEDTPGRG